MKQFFKSFKAKIEHLLMTTVRPNVVTSTRALGWCSLLSLVFVALILILPVSPSLIHSYNLSSSQYKTALLLINIPFMLVWFIAFIGSYKLRAYARVVQDAPEGAAFDRLATGATWLAWSLPVSAIAGRLLGGLANAHPRWHSAAIIIANYIGLLMPLVAFIIIGAAARRLLGSKKINLGQLGARLMMSLFLILGILYCYLTLKTFDLHSLGSAHNPYHLPAWLMVLSVIVPYLYGWFIALIAAYEISFYARRVPGVLYRQSLALVVSGLAAIVLSFIVSQYLSVVWLIPAHLSLNYHLLVIALFRTIGAIGFTLLAVGAIRLKRIEEV